jgi:hypothetical protein
MGEDYAMMLALRILGVVYIAAMAVLGGLWREALRRSPAADESPSSAGKVIPFERGLAPSVSAEARDR